MATALKEAPMKIPLIAAIGLTFQAAAVDDLYKFKVDTTWTYKRLENGVEKKVTARVAAVEEGRVRLEWKTFDKEGTREETSAVTWSVVEGILTAEARTKREGEEDQVLTFGLLKAGSKKDDTWTTPLGNWTHLGTVEVAVPAGTWKDAVRSRLKIGDDTKIEFTLVPKVGLVKIEIQNDAGENSFALTEFKEPKK